MTDIQELEMALSDDIAALPNNPVGGQLGINSNIGTLNRGMKAHEAELLEKASRDDLTVEIAQVEAQIGDALTQGEADTRYVPSLSPRTSYTWDATTGSIKTITEHFDAPIGDRVTTFGAYNSAGDPTTETDPSGQVWTLAYDSAGNISTRTKVA